MPKYKVKAGHFSKAGKVGPAPDYLWIPGESFKPGDIAELTEAEAAALGLHRFESGADYTVARTGESLSDPSNDEWEKAQFENNGLTGPTGLTGLTTGDNVHDLSPGDVIAADDPDGTIILDDGTTTWNDKRTAEFLAQSVPVESPRPNGVPPIIVPAIDASNNPWSSIVTMNGPDCTAIVDATQDAVTLDAIEAAEKSGRNRVGVLERVRVHRAKMGWS